MSADEKFENYLRKLEVASGIAGELTGQNKRNRDHDNQIIQIGETAVLKIAYFSKVSTCALLIIGAIAGAVAGLIFGPELLFNNQDWVSGIVGWIAGYLIGSISGGVGGALTGSLTPLFLEVFLLMIPGALGGIGTGVYDVGKVLKHNKSAFFNHKGFVDVATSVVTAASSFVVSIFFAVEFTAKFLGYFGWAIGKILTCSPEEAPQKFGLAADSFVKIFSNLSAAMFHPILNLCMAKEAPKEESLEQNSVAMTAL